MKYEDVDCSIQKNVKLNFFELAEISLVLGVARKYIMKDKNVPVTGIKKIMKLEMVIDKCMKKYLEGENEV